MLAARAHRDEDTLRIEEIPVPEIARDEILIRVHSSGLSRGLVSLWRAHTQFMPIMPTTLGTEGAGTVEAVGDDVPVDLSGQRVLLDAATSCRTCRWCRSGDEVDCPSAANIGHAVYSPQGMPSYLRYHNGTLAQYVRAPWWSAVPIPDDVSYEDGARIQSVAMTYHSVSRTGVGMGDTLVVNAATGAYGAGAIAVARLFGLRRVVAVARKREALERTVALDPVRTVAVALEDLGDAWEHADLTAAILAANDDEPVDGVYDLVPFDTRPAEAAIQAMRKGGTAVLSAGNAGMLTLPYLAFMQHAWVVRGSRGPRRLDLAPLLSAAQRGELDVSTLIRHRFPLTEVNDAVSTIWDRTDHPWFVAVNPPQE
jgi:threonine dehydrogenase-like Zn-dependent dehydrogenase